MVLDRLVFWKTDPKRSVYAGFQSGLAGGWNRVSSLCVAAAARRSNEKALANGLHHDAPRDFYGSWNCFFVHGIDLGR